jgi:hypothetical protein
VDQVLPGANAKKQDDKPVNQRLSIFDGPPGRLSITVSGSDPLTWEGLITGLYSLKKHAQRLYEGGKEINELARTLRAS